MANEICYNAFMLVYFIQAEQTKLIKIGYTNNHSSLQKRFNQLSTENADKLKLLATVEKGVERAFHEEFGKERQHGEWFQPSERLVQFINSLAGDTALIEKEYHKRVRQAKNKTSVIDEKALSTTMEKLGC